MLFLYSMSNTNSLHYQLCLEGAKWMHRRKHDWKKCQTKDCHHSQFCHHCETYDYVVVELVVYGAENTDVWGYCCGDSSSAVIEVKTSHSDFLADKKKFWRSQKAEDMEMQAGMRRWYLCPEGVIKPEELPEGWGLLWWDGKKIKHIVPPTIFHKNTSRADMIILTSILRREGFKKKVYNYRDTNPRFKKNLDI